MATRTILTRPRHYMHRQGEEDKLEAHKDFKVPGTVVRQPGAPTSRRLLRTMTRGVRAWRRSCKRLRLAYADTSQLHRSRLCPPSGQVARAFLLRKATPRAARAPPWSAPASPRYCAWSRDSVSPHIRLKQCHSGLDVFFAPSQPSIDRLRRRSGESAQNRTDVLISLTTGGALLPCASALHMMLPRARVSEVRPARRAIGRRACMSASMSVSVSVSVCCLSVCCPLSVLPCLAPLRRATDRSWR